MLVLEAIGNLGADAIIKDLNGQKYIAFSVAHTESYKDSQGQRHERTTWVSCLKYGESQVINYLKKGTRVFIRGELSAKAYEAGGALPSGTGIFAIIATRGLSAMPENRDGWLRCRIRRYRPMYCAPSLSMTGATGGRSKIWDLYIFPVPATGSNSTH